MRRLLGIGIALTLAGCITPSIPIPPPDPSNMVFHLTTVDGSTSATMTYPPDDLYKGGIAFVRDEASGLGSIQNVNPDGSVGPITLPPPVKLGDQVVFSVENGDQTVSSCVVLREGAQDPTVYCGP